MKRYNYITNKWEEVDEVTIDKKADKKETLKPSDYDDIAPVKRTWFSKGAFNDGYDIGDVTKTILGTAGDLGLNAIHGVGSAIEGAGDLLTYGVAGVSDLLGADKFADFVKKEAAKDEVGETFKPLEDYLDKYSVLGEKTDSLGQSAGQLGLTIALQSVGVPWQVTTGATSFSSGLSDAYQNDATDGEAIFNATVGAGAEILTESLFKIPGIKATGSGKLGNKILGKFAGDMSSTATRNMANWGINIVGEGVEEVATSFFQRLGQSLSYEREDTIKELMESEEKRNAYVNQLGEKLFGEEARSEYGESFIGGAALSGGFGAKHTYQSIKQGRDINTGLTDNEQRIVDKEVETRKAETQKEGKKLSKKEIAKIEEEVKNELQKGYISTDLIESEFGGEEYKAYRSALDKKTSIENEIKELENKPYAELTVKENERLQAIREELKGIDTNTLKSNLESSMGQKIAKDGYLQNSYREKEKKRVKFNADLSKYDAKQQETIQKAIDSGILNDTNKTHEFVDMIAKISADKGVSFDFANNQKLKDSGFAIEGKQVNGFINENGITLNMDSSKALNKVVGHEITHVLEGTELYTELQNALMEYDITKKEYGTRYNELKKLYKGVKDADIKKELTADLVGDYIFNDPDFVNNLSTKKPNVFKKIYDEIKYLFKIATAGSKEARQLEKVKKIFEDAYKQSAAQTGTNTKYSIQEATDGSKYVNIDTNQDIFEGKTVKEQKAIARKYILDNFKENGLVLGDDVVGVNSRTASEYTNPKTKLNKKTTSSKMRASTELDNILEVSTYKYSKPDDGRHNFAKDGWDYYETTFKVGDNTFTGLINIGKNGNKKTLYDITQIKKANGISSEVKNTPTESTESPFSGNTISQNTNNVKYSLTDNQGRTLTKEQQEYFKDSKVRDENGNLLTMYHGSPSDFTIFDRSKAKASGLYGRGFYFTSDGNMAKSLYEKGGKTYEVYLDSKNPLRLNQNNITREQFKKFVEAVAENEDYSIENYGTYDANEVTNMVYGKGDFEAIQDINATAIGDMVEAVELFNEVNGTNYDGIEAIDQFVVFNSNQIKNIDNTNPTSDADIRYSLGNQDIAPSRNDIYGSDIKLQVEEAIAPLKEEIAELKEALDPNYESTVDYNAITEEELPYLEQQYEEDFKNIDESYAPIEQEDTTPEADDEITATKSLEDVRDFDEVGSRKVKAYQYENPEVRPYFQEMARYMLGDLENSVKGERGFNDQLYYDTAGEQGFYGTTRETTDDIAELLDSKYNYTYKDIRKGLEAIIEDHGAENIAVAKRIELALDKRLREGYTDVAGYEIPANQEYLRLMEAKEIDDYYDSLPINESMMPVEEDIAPVVNASNPQVNKDIAPVRRNIDWDSVEDTSQGNQIAFNEEGKTVEIISELEKKQQRAYKKLGSKEDYISNKAYELYDEVKNLKKGVKASYELGRVLDVAFANINELTEGMTETRAKEVKNTIWRDVTTSLLNVKAKPLSTVNKNSTIEAVIRQNINREYDSKKNEIANMKEEDLVTKTKKELRKELLIDESDFFINALDNAKNRSMALMNNTDTIRNTELVFGRENAKIINEKIFQKEIDNEADSIAWQNKERDEIKALGIKARSKESAAVQKYGEKQYVNDVGELVAYGDKELASEFGDVETQEKIKRAAQVIRNKYDNYIDRANEVLTRLGFDPIPKRNDYMRHFQELNDVFSRYGIPFNAQSMTEHVLPTDINGLTENWSPQKNYFANTQKRTGLKTTYDAITGVDGYIGGIANLIYHTEDIQRGRAFEELIRETYGEDKGFENLENLPDELKQARAEKIQDNHLSNYAAWVHEWTNHVAGKKSKIDRSVESMFGRKAFSFLDGARKQVGANMIGFNLSSSLTNLIAPVQAMAKTNKLAVLKGTADTIKNMFIKDDFMNKNKFLTSRMGTDMLSKNAWQKIQDAGFVFMKGMDWFSSNQIVRSKYYELRAKGMSEQQAHSEAGQFAARIMGDRTKGANAQLYNSKLVGLVTQFQLEVNNQLYSMFYDTYHESKENAQNNALRTTAGMTFTLGQLFAFTHLFGKTFEAIAGYNPTFDVIGMLATALGLGEDEDEEKTTSERLKTAADQLVDALPYVNILTGGGRIPVASGLPNLVGVATGGKDQYGNELTLEDELKKLLFLVPPTGGNQVKKTTQGLSMFDGDLPVSGSYTDSGNLRFPVEETPLNVLQAALFGQWANKNAGEYFDNERQPLKEKQIQEYKDLDMPISDYWKYREGLKDKKTTEEKFEYINGLDVSDEQKNIMINNALTRKEQVDMSGYDDFGSYEEFDFATKNPEKYEIITQIDTYDNYVSYEDDIASIKEQFSNEHGYSTAERKQAVFQYINSLRIGIPQKIMLMKMAGGYSIKSYSNDMFEYINSLPMTIEEKERMYNQLFN